MYATSYSSILAVSGSISDPRTRCNRKCTSAHGEKMILKKERKHGLGTLKHIQTEDKEGYKAKQCNGGILLTQSKRDHKPKTTHKFLPKGRGRQTTEESRQCPEL